MIEDQLGQEATPPNPEEGFVSVTSLDQFVQFLTAWHADKCAMTRHMLELPEGAEFQIGDGDDKKTFILAGEVLESFKFGIEMALMQLGTLPFVAEVEEPAPEPVPG